MSSIRISLNGEHRHTVSLEGNPGVISCILNYRNGASEDELDEDKEEYHLLSGGIDKTTQDFVDWPRLDLSIGDRIELEILEPSESLPPAIRRHHAGEPDAVSQKDYIRAMAKQWGWKIIEHE